jgi:hypothetical protein
MIDLLEKNSTAQGKRNRSVGSPKSAGKFCKSNILFYNEKFRGKASKQSGLRPAAGKKKLSSKVSGLIDRAKHSKSVGISKVSALIRRASCGAIPTIGQAKKMLLTKNYNQSTHH